MTAETLIQAEVVEACFWLANLLSEILFSKPNDDKIKKIECFTDNHQLYDSVYSIRSIQEHVQKVCEILKLPKFFIFYEKLNNS